MIETNPTGVDEFTPVGVLETKCNVSAEIVRENVSRNIRRNLPRLHQLPDYGKHKGPKPLAVVAGGPSLNQTMGELRQIENLMVCCSSHDHVISRGFAPRYAVMCDADPSVADFLKYPDHRCTYFIATMCDAGVFEALSGFNVVMWNNFQGDIEMFRGEPAIAGGCTGTLRAINIAIMLGWSNLHFFGLDSSFADSEYAYEGNPEPKVKILARAGNREFQTTPGWLAQATHFREMCMSMAHFFTPTVHGDSLISAMVYNGEK